MCGIAGVMTADGRPPEDRVLSALTDALAHRGPDGRGRYVAGDVGMVHTRLAIIDLQGGTQPLYAASGDERDDEDGWIALVANAEIYNYVELRHSLGEREFATGSDCEPPLHLYARHGVDFADRLRGMYAIALHDPRHGTGEAGRLLLARDPFGIKPLYYVEGPFGLAFASEPAALIAAGLAEAGVREEARAELLQLQFTTGAETIFPCVRRVLPGETLVAIGGRIVERHRRPALSEGAPKAVSEEDALAALDAHLDDTVRLHQRADVPYAMFLSGGIDSSVLLTVMRRLNPRPVLAFTAGFPGASSHDERAHARVIAQSAGAEHVDVAVTEHDFWRTLPAIAAAMDDPAADYAVVPSYLLAAQVRAAGLKVVLTGEGGDELFGGYGRYRRALRPRLLGGRPMRARGILDGLGILRDGVDAGWRSGIDAAEAAVRGTGWTPLQQMQAADCADWLPNDLLAKVDRCLMAHGVEGRVPFIDAAVAAFAFGLPDELKVRRGLGKRVLRRWLEAQLPAARPFARKRGFTVPVASWLGRRAAELAPLVAAQPALEAISRPGSVAPLFARAATDPRAAKAAWTLLFYVLWHRRHVLARAPAGDVFETLADAV